MGAASRRSTCHFTPPIDCVLDRLRNHNLKGGSGHWTARCPAHDDHNNSLSISIGADGKVLVKCFTGCDFNKIMAALDLKPADAFPGNDRMEGAFYPPHQHCNTATPPGCTLAQYAGAKRLPIDKLRSFGLRDISYLGHPAVRIPYYDGTGLEVAARYRIRLNKSDGDRFKWKSGANISLYGRERLTIARERGYVALAEGESDCHVLWCHDEPAVGMPGADTWKDARDAPELDGIATIYVIDEGDTGGDAVKKWLPKSSIRERVKLVNLVALFGVKDPSELYLSDPDNFPDNWQKARNAAVPWTEQAAHEAETAAAEAWTQCETLAQKPDIPAEAARALAAAGVAGETRVLKLLYLIVNSRFLARPVSAAIKGPSSGGKSFTLEQVLSLFPDAAYYALSAMSERALAYDEEPLVHRYLVIYEAAGLSGDFASYLVRSLLSEGRVRYVTVEKTRDGLKHRLIEREGPSGLLVTTTAVHLHPENETRMLSLPVTDTREQTAAILRALAEDRSIDIDLMPWHALQTWLDGATHEVAIPFAVALSKHVPPAAVRLRRDFGTVLALIRAHAILHQALREKDDRGRIVATLDDYAAVRALVGDLIADGIGATVSPSVRQTVTTVRTMLGKIGDGGGGTLLGKVREDAEATVSVTAIAKALKLDKSATSRRVRVAIDEGYLKNLEDKRGRPARITVGEPLPDDLDILPSLEVLQCCSDEAGDNEHSPPSDGSTSDSADAPDADLWTTADEREGENRCAGCGQPMPADRTYYCEACTAESARRAQGMTDDAAA